MIDDKPITIDGWTPVNSDRVYRGRITLREAFARSSNAATVRLSQQVGRANVIRAARDLGITTPAARQAEPGARHRGRQPARADLGLCGGRERPLSDRRARAARQQQPPEGLSAFFRSAGALDRQRDWAPMLDLLYAAANNGTGRRAALAVPTFGKTGTTQENRDALFIGFAGDLVVGVWVGRDDNKSLGKISGGTVPAEIWRSFMTSALAIDSRAGRRCRSSSTGPSPTSDDSSRVRCRPNGATPTKPLRDLARQIEELIGDDEKR